MSICIAHRCKPPLMRSGMARVRGITQFYLTPTRLSTNWMNHPAFTPCVFTRWRHRSKVAHIRLKLTTHLSTSIGWKVVLAQIHMNVEITAMSPHL